MRRIERLGRENIQRCAAERTAAKRLDQRCLVDQRAARRIDDNCPGFARSEQGLVDEVPRRRVFRRVKRNKVGALHQFLKRRKLQPQRLFEPAIPAALGVKNLHAERPQIFRDLRLPTWPSPTSPTTRPVRPTTPFAGRPIKGPAARRQTRRRAQRLARLLEAARERQHQQNDMFGDKPVGMPIKRAHRDAARRAGIAIDERHRRPKPWIRRSPLLRSIRSVPLGVFR